MNENGRVRVDFQFVSSIINRTKLCRFPIEGTQFNGIAPVNDLNYNLLILGQYTFMASVK